MATPARVDADTAWFELALTIECGGWPAHLDPRPDERELRAHIAPGWWRACPTQTPITLWLSAQLLPSLARTTSRADALTTLNTLCRATSAPTPQDADGGAHDG